MRIVRGTLDMDGVTPDANGDIFTAHDIVGWDAAVVEYSLHPRLTSGDVITHVRYSHYSLVIQGQAWTPTAGTTDRIRRKIVAAFGAVAADVTMSVYWDINVSMQVRRAPGEPPRFSKPAKNAPVVEFEIPLIATNLTKTAI